MAAEIQALPRASVLANGPLPLVAVLMAVYSKDDPDHLAQALSSMMNQSYKCLVLMIMIDGEVADEIERVIRDCRLESRVPIEIYRSKSNRGLAVALNELIEHALRREDVVYLARMDSDDLSHQARIARQVEFMENNVDISVSGCFCREMDGEGLVGFEKALPTAPEHIERFNCYRTPFIHPTVIMRRSLLDRGIRYDPSFYNMQDVELWCRLLLQGFRLANLNEYLLDFRLSDEVFRRRGGMYRSLRELKLRISYSLKKGFLAPRLIVFWGALFLVRNAPASIAKRLYKLRNHLV